MSCYKELYKFRFVLNTNLKNFYYPQWINWKDKVENSHLISRNTYFELTENWKSNCLVHSNKYIPVLTDNKGGLGYNGLYKKKILFEKNLNQITSFPDESNNDIVMDIINTEKEKWSFGELEDLMQAFIKTTIQMNKIWEDNLFKGHIEITEINKFRI